MLENYIEPALYSGKILINLVNDLLDLAQLKAGKFKVQYINFNLKKTLYETYQMMKTQSIIKGI